MNAAEWPRADRASQRLMLVQPNEASLSTHQTRHLPALLRAGDLLVVNDAATLPASLSAMNAAGERFELRIAGQAGDRFRVLCLGAGDFRQTTEERGPAPPMAAGEKLWIVDPKTERVCLEAAVLSARAGRIFEVGFGQRGAALWAALYRAGRPIQYSYVAKPLPLWHVQNVFAARPWAVEPPSAALGLDWETLLALRSRQIRVCAVTHEAGLSSTGSPELDAVLPFAERYDVSERTVRAIAETKRAGGRVIAMGTTVVRALESAALTGELRAGEGLTETRITAEFSLQVVDGIVSGMHEPGSSHFNLLEAFAPASLLLEAHELATRLRFSGHEFGDACLVFRATERERAELCHVARAERLGFAGPKDPA